MLVHRELHQFMPILVNRMNNANLPFLSLLLSCLSLVLSLIKIIDFPDLVIKLFAFPVTVIKMSKFPAIDIKVKCLV